MVILVAPKDPLIDPLVPTLTEETVSNTKDITGLEKALSDQFGRIVRKEFKDEPSEKDKELEKLNDFLTVKKMVTIQSGDTNEIILPSLIVEPTSIEDVVTQPLAEPTLSLIQPPMIPAQKDVLAVRENSAPTDIETAELAVRDDISRDVLILAMAFQEEGTQQEMVLPTNLPKDPHGLKADFPVLEETLNKPSAEITFSDEATPQVSPQVQHEQQDKTILQRPDIYPEQTALNTEISATQSASLTKKPESLPPTQSSKTKEPTMTTDLSLKETARALEAVAAERHSEGDLDLDHEMKEELTKSNKGAPKALTSGKTFAENMLTTAGKSETLVSTDTLSSSPQSTDGKVIEAAFNRAPETQTTSKATASSGTQASQHTLPPQASITEQIAFSIKNNAAKGSREINLQLRPSSLGQVNVKIDINQEGQTFVVVAMERSETRDLLQQDARQLTALLKESGIDVGEDNVSYNLFSEQNNKEEESREGDTFAGLKGGAVESAGKNNQANPMIPLGLGEVQIHANGTWAVVA